MKLKVVSLFLLALSSLTWSPAQSAGAADCNSNGVEDSIDVESGDSRDCNSNSIPDECDLFEERAQFEIARRYEAGKNADDIVSSDFDGDGDVDMAISVGDSSPGIAILWNRGRLDFEVENLTASEDRLPSERALALRGADLNGDGHLDLIGVLRNKVEIVVILNNGDGSFAEGTILAAGSGLSDGLSTGDIDGDGDVDLALASLRGSAAISVFINDGAGNLTRQAKVESDRPVRVQIVDYDQDGNGDLIVANQGTDEEPLGQLSLYRSEGNGTFTADQSFTVGERPMRIATRDFNHDGLSEILVLNNNSRTVSVLVGAPGGEFENPVDYAVGHASEQIAMADFDGDGETDLAITGRSQERSLDDMAVLFGNGDSTFSTADRYSLGDNTQPHSIVAADLNGDGHLDLSVGKYRAGDVAVFQNRGDGVFDDIGSHNVSHGGTITMVLEDFDLDGDLDIATASLILHGSLSILENVTGTGLVRGCDAFLRGDANLDGQVSSADAIMIQRYLFDQNFDRFPRCADAADANDTESVDIADVAAIVSALFLTPDWLFTLPAPFPNPGLDPDNHREFSVDDSPLDCADAEITPPEASDDLIAIRSTNAQPGTTVRVPIEITSSVPVEAVQIVLSYDHELLQIASDLDFEGSIFEGSPESQRISIVADHEESGVMTLLISNQLFNHPDTPPISPGESIIGSLVVSVSENATPGAVLPLEPTDGANGQGFGQYRLRNEIVHRGGARFVSLRPNVETGFMAIVGDQSFFRGDSNTDRRIDISDPIHTLTALFLGGSRSICPDAADSNDDGTIDISDPTNTLSHLFSQSPQSLPEPYEFFGKDPTDDELGCAFYPEATQ